MMDNEQINEYLTIVLFGECWHERKVGFIERPLVGEVLESYCVKCKQVNAERCDYFKGDGMLKVIDAMRSLNGYTSAVIETSFGPTGFQARFGNVVDHHPSYADTLPEAVARAAVEFLQATKV